MPSPTDWEQYADWIRDFGQSLIGLIVVADDSFGLWGDAVEQSIIPEKR